MKNKIVNTNTPRWIILTLDVLISLFALVIAYLVSFNFKSELMFSGEVFVIFAVFMLVRLASFIAGATYAGIVRFTSTQDAYRIFSVLSIGSLFLFAIDYIVDIVNIPYALILIEYLVLLFMMVVSRLLVKMLYYRYIRNFAKYETIVIYGSDEFAISAKSALDSSIDTKANIIAFIDYEGKKKGKKIEGVKIYPFTELRNLFVEFSVDKLIFAKKDVELSLKKEIVDICLDADVKVCEVPKIDAWVDGAFKARQIKPIRIDDLLERESIHLDTHMISEQVKGKVVLVTGAAGSIGSEMVRQVARFKPSRIILLDQAESPMYEIDLELREKLKFNDFELVMGDVRDRDRLRHMFNEYKPNLIYHAAAYKHVPMMEENPSEAIKTNVLGTRNVADMACEFNVDAFVMVSTDKAVNPTNVMGASKRLAEMYIQALSSRKPHTKFITTRFGNVLGSNGSVIPRFKAQIEAGGPITVTHPDITRFFMTIPEACQLVLQAGAVGKGGRIFVFDMGESVKIVDLARKMIKLSGLKVNDDIKITFSGLRPGEKLYEELLSDKENTYETEHKRILIAKVRDCDYEEVKNKFDKFEDNLLSNDNLKIVSYMKEIVPEFKSKNSIYEKLDSKAVLV